MFYLRRVSQLFHKKTVRGLSSKNNVADGLVRVKQGLLQGSVEGLPSGNTFASFKGIPYAKPPLGDLRFKAPLPPESWNGVREAKEHGDICPQFDMATGMICEGNEDCLLLNVYTPYKDGPALPVMVWLHGGGFFSGSGDSVLHGPEYLVDENVILVTLNNRLEVLGYLCMDNQDVPGNAGMKDQVAAFKWVRDNISQFGGDPNNVTIFGESAGGGCVAFHMVSPMSRNLGHKFISQSGSCIHEWASAPNPRERAFRLGKYLGKDTKDDGELLKFLRSVPPIQLVKVTRETQTDDELIRGLPIRFVPVVEKSFVGQQSFLPKSALQLLKEGSFQKSPLMIGYNNREGLFALRDTIKKADALNVNFDRKVPRFVAENVNSQELMDIAREMKALYFGDKNISKETSEGIINLETDYNFVMDLLRFAKIVANESSEPVFLNRFSVDDELNITKTTIGHNKFKGACHADDLFYLFKTGFEVEESSSAWKSMKRMTRLWTNFAKYGNPTPKTDNLITVKWDPVTRTDLNFMEIGSELKMDRDPEKERFAFWSNLYKRFSD